MKKSLLAIIATTLLSTSSFAEDTCDTANGYSKSNTIFTPAFYTHGTQWTGYFYVTNVSQEAVTVKLSFTDSIGQAYTPYSLTYNENFHASNTPIDLANGAILAPGEAGYIAIHDNNTFAINVGKLSWSSDICLEHALMANYLNTYSPSKGIAAGMHPLNGGKPF